MVSKGKKSKTVINAELIAANAAQNELIAAHVANAAQYELIATNAANAAQNELIAANAAQSELIAELRIQLNRRNQTSNEVEVEVDDEVEEIQSTLEQSSHAQVVLLEQSNHTINTLAYTQYFQIIQDQVQQPTPRPFIQIENQYVFGPVINDQNLSGLTAVPGLQF